MVTPLYKSGDKLDPRNYRPVSLTSICCKIAEKIIVAELLQHALNNEIIPKEQHGFLPGRSVVTNLLDSANVWTKIVDRGQPLDIIYLDFSKAFDKVPHNFLIHKLNAYGIKGRLLQWINAFLSNRSFCVRVGKSFSVEMTASSGVPQGSVLGPILFLLYTADLLSSIGCPYSAYADDIKIFGNPLDVDFQAELNKIVEWSNLWRIPLNASKCCVLHCGLNNPNKTFIVNGSPLMAKNSQKDLGVIVTNKLSWSEQSTAAAGKAKRMLFLLKKVFRYPSYELIKKLYCTYIRPHLEYAIPVWRPSLVRDIETLEKVQHQVTRWTRDLCVLPYNRRLDLISLTSLKTRQNRADLIQMFRITHDLFPQKKEKFLQIATDKRLRGHRFKISKEPFKTTTRKTFLTNRAFDLWNDLSANIVEADSVYKFKKLLDDRN